MKVYVAASSQHATQAARFMREIRQAGHEITYDWTVDVLKFGAGDPKEVPEDVMRKAAENDRRGVRECHLFILLWSPMAYGALMELGMAMERRKRIWIIGESEPGPGSVRFSVFWLLPDIQFEIKYGWEAIQELEHGDAFHAI